VARGLFRQYVSLWPLVFDQIPKGCVVGMSHLSTSLRSESEKYRKAARDINFQAMLRQYAPLGVCVFLLIIVAGEDVLSVYLLRHITLSSGLFLYF
jgi:hypothetical protein